MKIEAMLLTQSMRHGARGFEERRNTSSAMLGRLNAALTAKSESTSTGNTGGKRKGQADKPAKAYGSHNGTTHVHKFLSVEGDEANDVALQRIAAAIDELTAVTSIDIRAKKFSYKQAKNQLEADYREQHGNRLTEDVFAELQNKKAALSFRYHQSQIVVVVTSAESFPGGEWDEDRRLFVQTSKSKTVYSLELLVAVAQAIQQFEESEVFTKPARKSMPLDSNRVLALFDTEKGRFIRLRADEETRDKLLGKHR